MRHAPLNQSAIVGHHMLMNTNHMLDLNTIMGVNILGVNIMRMWQINPNYMCQQHQLGEHNELHKNRHNFVKKHSIKGRIYPVVQIEPESMKRRHDELAKYMNHKSPYTQPDLSHLPDDQRYAKVDTRLSLCELVL